MPPANRVKFEEIGKSTMGAPFVYATISAPQNLARLNDYKQIQRKLADPRLLSNESQAASLIARGKTVVAITCGIHSTEVGSYLSSMLIAHRLASSNEPEVLEILKNTIILLVPSTNPDGVDIVNNWYQKTLGTPYEGTDPPELYHKYTGHDDNRDWYAFTQVETQLVVDKILNVWHPQIVHDIHQQGAFGSRLFLPPYMPPVEPTCRNRSSKATPNSEIIWRKRCARPDTKASRPIRLMTPGRLRARTRIHTAAYASCRRRPRAGWLRQSR
jgi:hypothetical protein